MNEHRHRAAQSGNNENRCELRDLCYRCQHYAWGHCVTRSFHCGLWSSLGKRHFGLCPAFAQAHPVVMVLRSTVSVTDPKTPNANLEEPENPVRRSTVRNSRTQKRLRCPSQDENAVAGSHGGGGGARRATTSGALPRGGAAHRHLPHRWGPGVRPQDGSETAAPNPTVSRASPMRRRPPTGLTSALSPNAHPLSPDLLLRPIFPMPASPHGGGFICFGLKF